MKKLGKRQMDFLEALRVHNVWQRGGGWSFHNNSTVTAVVDALEPLGVLLVLRDERGVSRVERADGMLALLFEQRELRG